MRRVGRLPVEDAAESSDVRGGGEAGISSAVAWVVVFLSWGAEADGHSSISGSGRFTSKLELLR